MIEQRDVHLSDAVALTVTVGTLSHAAHSYFSDRPEALKALAGAAVRAVLAESLGDSNILTRALLEQLE